MKFTKIHQKKWASFKKLVSKNKQKFGLQYPKWTYALDKKSKEGNIRICYTIPYLDEDGKVKNKHKQKYLKNITFKHLDTLTDKYELHKYHDLVQEERDVERKTYVVDESTIQYWVERFLKRNETDMKVIKESSLRADKYALMDLQLWLEKNKPKTKSIYKVDKKLIREYLTYRNKVGGVSGKKWNAGNVNGVYCRIRSWYNWVQSHEKLNLEKDLLSKMDRLPKVILDTSSFTKSEIQKVIKFMKKEKNSKVWGWFIPMLKVLIQTGCRIGECVKMRIEDIDLNSREWYFHGKGDKKRRMPIKDKDLWNEIESRIVAKDGTRYEKEFVFHREFYKKGNKGSKGYECNDEGMMFVQQYDKHYHICGVRNKFRKMIKHLQLNPKLSPHSCRRFFITEMLKSTSDIPLISSLVGHKSWAMVMRYSKDVIQESSKTNLDLDSLMK